MSPNVARNPERGEEKKTQPNIATANHIVVKIYDQRKSIYEIF